MARSKFLEERFTWVWLGAAMLVAAVLLIRFSRETTFSIDELVWYMQAPSLDLETALKPQAGHLLLTSHLVYKALLETVGADYLAFRLLGIATLLLTVGLLFTFVRRRFGGFVALAPSLVLLLFGSDITHTLTGNAFTVLLALSCGLGALLALEREDRRGDVIACALLILGVVTYSITLAFVVGAAVLILQGPARWRRAWVFAIPALLYGVWWLWARTLPASPESQAVASNILLLPAWAFQSLSAVIDAFTGLGYEFQEGQATPEAGPAVAVLALIALAVVLIRRSPSRMLWATFATLLALWVLGVLTVGGVGGNRFPDSPRFMLPGAVVVLVVAVEAARGLRWSRGGLAALYVVALAGASVNLMLLHDGGAELRSNWAVPVAAAAVGVELAGTHGRSSFRPPDLPPGHSTVVGTGIASSPFNFPFAVVDRPADALRAAADRYGSLGFSVPQLEAEPEAVREEADLALVAALGIRARATPPNARPANCRTVSPPPEARPQAILPRGGATLFGEDSRRIFVHRFAERGVYAGRFHGGSAILDVPDDAVPVPWRVSVAAGSLRVCQLP